MIADTKERINPKSRAHQKLATKKPETRYAVSNTRPAFITNVNRPIERKLMGRVNRISTGFKMALANPSTMAAVKAAIKLLTDIPGRKYGEARITSVDIIQLISIGIFFTNGFDVPTIITIFS